LTPLRRACDRHLMRKKDELAREHTCMQHAHPDEMVFVLIGRDPAAPVAIRAWVAERLRLGKNVATDDQITSALTDAATMEAEGTKWKAQVPECVQSLIDTFSK
jgi:hypothetical protein